MQRHELSVALSDAFPLTQVPDHLPANASGRKLHRHIAFRWALRGVRGIRLRTIEVPGIGKCTTGAWLADFVARINTAAHEAADSRRQPSTRRSGRQRRPTEDVLERHGLTSGLQHPLEGGSR